MLSAAGGSVRDSQAAVQVVSDGMNTPWSARIAISVAKSVVIAHTTLAHPTTLPPAVTSHRAGYRSASMPIGTVDSAIPRMTADTESEATDSPTPNSFGRIGCVT